MSTTSGKSQVAEVIGGPFDGAMWRVWIGAESFTPAKTANARPEYRLIGGKWVFVGYESNEQ